MLIRFMFGLLMLLYFTSSNGATSGTLILQGSIPQVLAISVVPSDGTPNDGTYSGLDMTQNTDVAVANVLEESNVVNGYRVRVTYDGKLTNTTNNSQFLNYSLKYAGQTINVGNNIVVTDQVGGTYSVNKEVRVAYTGVQESSLQQGTYQSQVTFTIEAK